MKNVLLSLGSGATVLLVVFLFSFNKTEETKGTDNTPEKTIIIGQKVVSWNIPTKFTFAGEEVPMEDTEVKERFDRELLVNTYWHTRTMLTLKRAKRWFPIITPILKKHGIPEDFKFLAVIESSLDPTATSYVEAVGMWQIMEGTAKELGLEVREEKGDPIIDERMHVEKATEAACKYLLKAHKEFGNWSLVAASYNGGVPRVRELMETQQVDNYYDLYLTTETYRFVFRILATKEIFSNPEKYGFDLSNIDEGMYEPYKTKEIDVTESIQDLPSFAINNGTTYKTLKLLNPWLRAPWLSNPEGKTYKLKVPA